MSLHVLTLTSAGISGAHHASEHNLAEGPVERIVSEQWYLAYPSLIGAVLA
jgi:hypothetical protein